MNPVASNPMLGVLLHGVGACFAATCYTPQKQVKRWSWQTYWLTQAAFCWFILPIVGAVLTIPDLTAVLREAPRGPMLNSFILGAAYGIGGTAFGISIRYIGFSLTYAIAVGLSSVLGTLIPPLVKGTLGTTLEQTIEGDSKSFNLRYIDWEHAENNVFHVTAEFAVERTREPAVA